MISSRLRVLGAALLCALAMPVSAGNVGLVPIPGPSLVDGNWLIGLAGGQNATYQNGITAHSGGGQTAAFQLPSSVMLLQVDTVAVANDSVALPVCVAPALLTLRNNGANSMNVFASTITNLVTATTDTINGSTNATAYAMPANSEADFYCIKNGQWAGSAAPANATYPASGILVGTTDAQTLTNKTLTTPTINGATLSGTFAGAFTTSGVQTPTGGIAAAGGFTISPRTFGTCGSNGGTVAATSAFTNQTPVITEVYIAEIFVPANVTVTGIAVLNGTVASGNLKVGLANSSGVNIATSVSTAAVGTSVYQLVPFTAPLTVLGPATYFVETFYDNNTQRATAWTQGSCGASKQTGQTYATGFTTITPATTFTTALGPVANLF